MLDAAGRTVTDLVQLKDSNGTNLFTQETAEQYMKDVSVKGSSLKKFTNMAVCLACHGSSIAKGQIDPQFLGGDGRMLGRSKIK
jgi:hypothetical protein